jgi:phosphate-selective porin
VESSNKASGYYLDMGWRFNQKWEADLRYDEFSKLTNSAFDERKTTTWTLGAQYFFSPALRFQVNYEIRNAKVVDPNAAGLSGTATQQHTQLSNNTTTLNTMGNRLSAQLTWIF